MVPCNNFQKRTRKKCGEEMIEPQLVGYILYEGGLWFPAANKDLQVLPKSHGFRRMSLLPLLPVVHNCSA